MNVSKKVYKVNKESKVNSLCVCPSCGKTFVKNTYQQAFCGIDENGFKSHKCKDKYWNTVTPEKRCNKTRISKAVKDKMDNYKFSYTDLNVLCTIRAKEEFLKMVKEGESSNEKKVTDYHNYYDE